QARTFLVGPQHVEQRIGVGGGRHVVDVQGLDVAGVIEDLGQLAGEGDELLLRELDPGQPGDVRDVLAGDLGHRLSIVGGPPRVPGREKAGMEGNAARLACVFMAMNALSVDGPAPVPWDAALITVYQDRYRELVRLAYLLTGQTAVAEEIVQDAFLASHRTVDRLRDPY